MRGETERTLDLNNGQDERAVHSTLLIRHEGRYSSCLMPQAPRAKEHLHHRPGVSISCKACFQVGDQCPAETP